MLHVVIGADGRVLRARARKVVGDGFVTLRPEETTDERLRELIAAQPLFDETPAVLLEYALDESPAKDAIVALAEALADSPRAFVAIARALDAESKKKLTKYADALEVLDKEKKGREQVFNVFSLTDAFAARKRKDLWVLFTRAKSAGVEDEQIHGVLVWMLKALLLAKSEKSAQAAGLSPFVYAKASRAAQLWEEEELRDALRSLITLYHESRRGREELGVALERFTLQLQ